MSTFLWGQYSTSWSNIGFTSYLPYSLAISPNYANDQTIFAGTWNSGVFKSTNGGGSWSNVGLTGTYIYPFRNHLAISPNYANDQTIFASAQEVDGGGGVYVYKSTNGGSSWTKVNIGGETPSLVISPNYSNDQTIFAANNGGVYKSTNGGNSWIRTGLTNKYIYSLAVSPNYANDQTVFAGEGGPAWLGIGGNIYKSVTAGSSWSQVYTGAGDTYVYSLALSPNYASDLTIFAGIGSPGSINGGVYKSISGGFFWTSSFDRADVRAIAIPSSYAANRTIFAGTFGGGVYSYTEEDADTPTTILQTSPLVPDGTNGWFKTTPSITLTRDEPGTTYYSWTSATGPWTTYSAPFNAPEGQNTLYYYSVDTANNAEAVKSQLFKVDTIPPSPPTLSAVVESSTSIRLEWTGATDVGSGNLAYEVHDGDRRISGSSESPHVLSGLSPGTTYNLTVRAVDEAGNLSSPSNTVSITTPSATTAPTPTGSNVTIDLGGGASITFENVTSPGETSLIGKTPEYSPPANFWLVRSAYYDVSTTATYSGYITIALSYDETQLRGEEKNLKLFHWKDMGWEDVTVSVDMVNNTITGRATSLSPFAVAEPAAPPVAVGYNTSWLLITAISLMIGGWYLLLRGKRKLA